MHHSRRLLTTPIVVLFLLSASSTVFAQQRAFGRPPSPELGDAIRIAITDAGREVIAALGTKPSTKSRLLQIKEVQAELKLEGDVLGKVKLALKGYSGKNRQINLDTIKALKAAEDGEQLGDEEASKLRSEVIEKITNLQTKTNKRLAALLTKDQWERLEQLQLQRKLTDGVHAVFLEKEMANKLKITPSQTKKLEAIEQEVKKSRDQERDEKRAVMQDAREAGGDTETRVEILRAMLEDLQATRAKRSKQRDEKAIALLSEEQRRMFGAMKGKAFKFPKSKRAVGGVGRGGGGGVRVGP